MNKFITTLIISFLSFSAFAQNMQWYRATDFSMKEAGCDWTPWEKSSVEISFDLVNNRVTIYSPVIQVYTIIKQVPADYDSNGIQEKYYVINKNGNFGYLRLRMTKDGTSQIYIDYSDISLVYNVIRFYL